MVFFWVSVRVAVKCSAFRRDILHDKPLLASLVLHTLMNDSFTIPAVMLILQPAVLLIAEA